jgi:hypothetical protein
VAVKTLLDLNVKSLLKGLEDAYGMKLPEEVVEISLVRNVLHVRFSYPKGAEGSEQQVPLAPRYANVDVGHYTPPETSAKGQADRMTVKRFIAGKAGAKHSNEGIRALVDFLIRGMATVEMI